MGRFWKNSLLFVFLACAGLSPAKGDDYIKAVGLIHMDSEVSGGDESLAMLAAVAKNADADVAIVTDHDTQKATYGMWPLRKLVRVSHSRASIRNYGVTRYLDEIANIDKDLDGFDFMAGIEAVPYYYWERITLQNKIIIKNLHRHLLVMGLTDPEDIEHLPSIETGYPSQYTTRSLMGLLWLVPLFITFFLFKPPDTHHVYYVNWLSRLFAHQINLFALPLMAVSVIFLFNNYPFKEPVIDQYGQDAGPHPYQYLIDYVNARDGLIFWAHPEASYNQRISTEQNNALLTFALKSVLQDGVDIVTEPYYDLLNATFDYTGFAIFFEGMLRLGAPEGMWDSLLLQFCKGTRERPVWAISEIDMESGTDPQTASVAQTVFLVKEKSKQDYLDALRKGRVYCYTEGLTHWVDITDYSIVSGGKKAISGEIIPYEPDAVLHFDTQITKHDLDLNAVVIKDGKILARQNLTGNPSITIPLAPTKDDIGYVRIVIYNKEAMVIATNPIFYRSRQSG